MSDESSKLSRSEAARLRRLRERVIRESQRALQRGSVAPRSFAAYERKPAAEQAISITNHEEHCIDDVDEGLDGADESMNGTAMAAAEIDEASTRREQQTSSAGIAGNRRSKRIMQQTSAADSESDSESSASTRSEEKEDPSEDEEDRNEQARIDSYELDNKTETKTRAIDPGKLVRILEQLEQRLVGFHIKDVGNEQWNKIERNVLPHDDTTELLPFSDTATTKGEFARDFRRICLSHGISGAAEEDLLVNAFHKHFPSICANLPVRETQRGRIVSAVDSYQLPSDRDTWFQICPNSCCVYVGTLQYARQCPECDAPRFRACKVSACKKRKNCTCRIDSRKALKSMNYRPLIPLLKRLVSKESFRKALQFQLPQRAEGTVSDLLHAQVPNQALQAMHQKYAAEHPDGSATEISLLLSEFYDGAQVFKRRYSSFWPLFVSILNLPPSYRNRVGVGMFLISLFTAEGSSLAEAFLFEKCLVPELLELYRGVEFTAAGRRYFLQARLIMHVCDGRALEKLCRVQGAGSCAGCALCHGVPGVRRKDIDRTVYKGHRAFTEMSHFSRRFGQTEMCCLPSGSPLDEETKEIDQFGAARKLSVGER